MPYRDNQQMIDDINLLGETEAIEAIEDLKNSRHFIQGTKGMKLEFDTNIVMGEASLRSQLCNRAED